VIIFPFLLKSTPALDGWWLQWMEMRTYLTSAKIIVKMGEFVNKTALVHKNIFIIFSSKLGHGAVV
jgi:hypothetical protein